MRISKIANVLSAIFLSATCYAQAASREIILAFDDTLAPATSLDGMARDKMLINNLAKVDVPHSLFLIKGARVTDKTSQRIQFYSDSGQVLINTGYNYSIYQRAKNYAFQIDLMKADGLLSEYLGYERHVIHPLLTQRGDAQQQARLTQFLSEHNYQPAYITTRVPDHVMNAVYQKRVMTGRGVEIRRIEAAWVKMILDAVDAYDREAFLMLRFSPRQVLALHANDLSAYCIIGLIDALNAKGYRVVAPDNHFSDPVMNPFFVSGFSAVSYMPYILGVNTNLREDMLVPTPKDEETVKRYLLEQGLEYLYQVN